MGMRFQSRPKMRIPLGIHKLISQKVALKGSLRIDVVPQNLKIKITKMSQPDYSWAEYLDYMEGGGSDVLTLPVTKPVSKPVEKKKSQPVWGVMVVIGVTIVAIWLSERPFAPFTLAGGRHPIEPVMLAIILGMVLSNSWALPRMLQPGIKFSVKKLLPLGIVLLGARLDFIYLLKVGAQGIALSLLTTVVAL